MRKQSKKPVGKFPKTTVADRPFDPAILERASEIARKYRIVLEPDNDCGYLGTSLEMPGVYNDGKTPDECVKSVRESLTIAVAYLIEKGKIPPLPEDEQVRNKQVNIRVTEAEQRRLREAALARGYSDISDYLRSSVLYPN
jgi:predicted RNase H-like HicB family nuclease